MFRQYQLTKENKRLVLRFAVSLLVTVILAVLLCTLSAYAEQGSAESAVQAQSTAEAPIETDKQPGDYIDTDPTYVGNDTRFLGDTGAHRRGRLPAPGDNHTADADSAGSVYPHHDDLLHAYRHRPGIPADGNADAEHSAEHGHHPAWRCS